MTVAFAVHIPGPVVAYICGLAGLSDTDRERLLAGVEQELGEHADRFLRDNPLQPPHPDHTERFWYDFVMLLDSGELAFFWFACDGRGHRYGVTEVLYVEQRTVPLE